MASSQLAFTYASLGLYQEANNWLQKTFALNAITRVQRLYGEHLDRASYLYNRTQRYDEAIEKSQAAIDVFREIHNQLDLIHPYRNLGDAWLGKEDWRQAERVYKEMLTHCETNNLPNGKLYPTAGLAFIACQRRDMAQMRQWIDDAMRLLSMITLSHESVGDNMVIYWRCYVVLESLGDERAQQILQTAYEKLQELADMIGETAVRRQFLQNVPANREVMQRMKKNRNAIR